LTDSSSDVKKQYHSGIVRKILLISVGLLLVIIFSIMACSLGTGISFVDTYGYIWDHLNGAVYESGTSDFWNDYYIWNNVMPSVVISIVAGAGLAIGGTVMQSIMGNPLADPYTTGISSGACLGAVLAIVIGFSMTSGTGQYGIISNAFIFALIPAFLVILLSKRVGNSPATIILIGVALSYFFDAFVTYLMSVTDTDSLQDAYIWQIGSVTGVGWADVPIMVIAVVLSSIVVYLTSEKLNLLMLGDDSAKSLGLNVEQFRTLCLILLSVLTAAVIAYTGIIGFVGLVSPHIARLIIGGNNKFVLPASMVVGAAMLALSNMVARSIMYSVDLPVGVVMSFIGAPIFLYLILRKKSNEEIY